ncbi:MULTISPECIES: S10 family peptidase [unclassified Thioalkalivibrio]|uniref:S10 family peptidase n=1 Tax=unclassified Thioalkalivibrio TaxID=2621013 RepID=UPI00036ABF35|nr:MULTISPECIES: hypothetical protein [unclassified Thioalkalivibrio]
MLITAPQRRPLKPTPASRTVASPFYGLALGLLIGPGMSAPLLANETEPTPPLPEAVTTEHSLELLDGSTLDYQATVGYVPLGESMDDPEARVFTVSYTVDSDEDRPVTFMVNGGPGAASAYLNVGGLGPRVLETDDQGLAASTPPRLVDNPKTWLAFTDLVFIDPVGTGFSRVMGGEADQYFSRDGDLAAMEETLERWLDEHGRRGDAVYLAGESYGGYRAAALPARIAKGSGISLSGTVLISPALDYGMLEHGTARPIGWALSLPAITAAAKAQGRLGDDPPSLEEAEAFALGDYLQGLIHPGQIDDDWIGEVARFTGLSRDRLKATRGRITLDMTQRGLLMDEGRLVSLYDGGIDNLDPVPTNIMPQADAILDGLTAPLSTAMLDHLRNTLDWEHGHQYRLLSRDVFRAWDWEASGREGHFTAMDELATALSLNRDFRIFSVHGEADLITPYFTTEWLLGQIAFAAGDEADSRIIPRAYPGGHMLYMRADTNEALFNDAEAFYQGELRADD